MEGKHEAIISPAVFDLVQDEMAVRWFLAKYDAAKTKYVETIAAISAKEAQSTRLTVSVLHFFYFLKQGWAGLW